MSMPAPHHFSPVSNFIERHDTLKAIVEWVTDRFADNPEDDDTIDWEDGEEHGEPHGPATL
jgi:hypothetical protein